VTGKRIALAILAVAVLAVLIYVAVGASKSKAGEPEVRMTEARGRTEIVDPAATARRNAPRLAQADGDAAGAPSGPGDDDTVHEYVKDDGTVVRDHRASDQDVPERKVSAKASIDIRNDVRPLFKECGKQQRARKRDERGRVQAVITTSIKDGRVRVEGLDLQVEGLTDSQYADCVRSSVEGFEMFAPEGQKDVDKHTLTIQFKVP
jgi:hypothetical protein